MTLRTGIGPAHRISRSALLIAIGASLAGCAMLETWTGAGNTETASLALASQRALEFLPDSESIYWTEPATNREARVMVLETLPAAGNRYCRILYVQVSATPNGVIERHCREPNASVWRFDGQVIEADQYRALIDAQPLANR